jgi:CRP-like cAMP-binding protein
VDAVLYTNLSSVRISPGITNTVDEKAADGGIARTLPYACGAIGDAAKMQTLAPVRGALLRTKCFRIVDKPILIEAETQCRWLKMRAGEMLFASGDFGDYVYFVVTGLVRCLYHSAAGRLVTLAEIGAGGMVGELAAIDGLPRTVDVIAVSDTVFAEMPAAVFRTLLRQGDVALGILREMSQRFRVMTERMVELSTLDVGGRVRCELLRIAGEHPAPGPSIRFPAPRHADLASRISANREAVTRELARLTRMGLIEKTDRHLVICNLPQFRQSLADLVTGHPSTELERTS